MVTSRKRHKLLTTRYFISGKDQFIMRFFLMLLAVTALSIGCGGSDTESNSTAPTTAANQVSFDVTGMT